MRDFKEFMLKARTRAGFATQDEAANAIGCNRVTVGMWEAPSSAVEKVSSKYLMRVAELYQVRPQSLTGESTDDGYPWTPPADASKGTSQVRRFDLEILAQAVENVGDSGMVPEDALFAEYERLKSLRVSDLAAKRKRGAGRDESKQRGSTGISQHPERKSRARPK